MKKYIFCFLLSFLFCSAQEKVNSTKKKFFVKKIYCSKYPALDNVLTQSSFYQMAPELKPVEIILKKQFFNINGFIKDVNGNGKLRIYVTVPLPKFTETKVDSVFLKDQRLWLYKPYSEFIVRLNIEIKSDAKLIDSKEVNYAERSYLPDFYGRQNLKTIVTENNSRLRKSLIDFHLEENDYGIESVIYNAMNSMQFYLDGNFGYTTTTDKIRFEFLTSKEHPEYEKIKAFEKEVAAELEAATLQKALDVKLMTPHLNYLESLLEKYPANEQNRNIRFMLANNLAECYLLLENKEKTLQFTDLLIKNDKQEYRGKAIKYQADSFVFEPNKIRSHTSRFADLAKLGFQLKETEKDERLAFFEKVEAQEADWNAEKERRLLVGQKNIANRLSILDSISYQSNHEILAKLLQSYGGSEALKKIQKTHLLATLKLDNSNVPQTEEKWTTETNYLLRRKMPENYFEIINGADCWFHDSRDQSIGEKWKKFPTSDFTKLSNNLDPIFFLGGLRIDLWNNLEMTEDVLINGTLCYHFNYFEKVLNTKNRTVPKTDYHFFIDKATNQLIATEVTGYEDGNKSYFERKVFSDFKAISELNNGQFPFKISHEIEDFYGETYFEEIRNKIEINPVFANRIFMKEIYAGGFK